MTRLTDRSFKYTSAAATAKPDYLARKWDRLYPGWRKPKEAEVIQMPMKKAERRK